MPGNKLPTRKMYKELKEQKNNFSWRKTFYNNSARPIPLFTMVGE